MVLPKDISEWVSISAGIPQESILGPLLFLVYINYIVLDIDSKKRLFADDACSSPYMIVDKPVHTAIKLIQDLSKISAWADKWLVTFNTQKTESLLISRKINKPIHPPIVMNNDHIIEVVFENTCTWQLHINMISSKAWQRIYTMKLKFLLDRQTLQCIIIYFIYETYIRICSKILRKS